MSKRSLPRVLVIAVGEATLDLIEPWARSGELPNFRRFLDEGNVGPLRTEVPPITHTMWATLATGRRPGHHGIFDFWQRGADGKFVETNGARLTAAPIWQRLSDNGVASGIVNVPCSFPPRPIKGFMIAGQDAPGARRTIAHPPGLFDEVERKFGAYPLKDIFPFGRQKSDYLALFQSQVKQQTDVLEHLLREKEWSFFLTFFSATAMAQHFFWADMGSDDPQNPYRDMILTAYSVIDAALGRLMAAAGPDVTTFVISECGAGPLQSGVDLNAWLEREGFLRRKVGSRSGRAAVARTYRTAVRTGLTHMRMGLKRRLPQPLYYWVNQSFQGAKGRVQAYLLSGGIDWPNTVAWARGKEGTIFINRVGRDPHGVVEPGAQYARVREAIVAALEALTDPATGETAVARVHRSEDLYSGPMVEFAPDLTIEWRNTAYLPTEQEKESGEVFVTRMREDMRFPTTGSHRLHGILMATGPGIRRGLRGTEASILDLVPTWLRLLNQPVPDELEGRVLHELLKGRSPAAGLESPGDAATPEP